MGSQFKRLILDLVCIVNVVCLFLILPVEAVENRETKLSEDVRGSIQLRKNSHRLNLLKPKSDIDKNKQDIEKEAKSLLQLAQKHNKLGKFDLAINKLNYIRSLNIGNFEFKALVMETMGNSLQGKGKYEQAISTYQKSIKLNKSLSCLNNLVKAWIALIDQTNLELEAIDEKEYLESNLPNRNILTSEYNIDNNLSLRGKLEKQINSFKKSASKVARDALETEASDNSLSEVYALINWHKLSVLKSEKIKNKNSFISANKLFEAREVLESKLPSRALVFLRIEWSKIDIDNNIYWLKKAAKTASSIQDPVAQSHAAIELGQYYYDIGEFEIASEYARRSTSIAQANFLFENLYKAQWLAAKTYSKLGRRSDSITAYKNAIAALDRVNQNISSWSSVRKANYRQKIKPLYHELIDLLLGDREVSNSDIRQAIIIADKQRFSELQNYFGDDCFEVRNLDSLQASKKKEKNEALFYSIVLDNRSYIILKLPDGSFHSHTVDVSKSEIQKLAVTWRENLSAGNTNRFQIQGRQLYDLLITPLEKKLESSEFEVLVFIHDGILRNLPMAALYDGERYLVEKWASVSSLGLNISTREIPSSNAQALIFGLSRPNQSGWTDLEMVGKEVNLVHQLIGGQKYLNDDFTVSNLTERLDEKFYSVVHLATHGYFAGNVNDSFLLAYDGQISIADLENILQNQTAIDLLVLSACETAITSDSSLLGLAGVAARNGVKSILGSLWLVQDDLQSEAMKDFYVYLSDSENNKAVALQKVQQKLISQYVHPQNWAALNLIGDYR